MNCPPATTRCAGTKLLVRKRPAQLFLGPTSLDSRRPVQLLRTVRRTQTTRLSTALWTSPTNFLAPRDPLHVVVLSLSSPLYILAPLMFLFLFSPSPCLLLSVAAGVTGAATVPAQTSAGLQGALLRGALSGAGEPPLVVAFCTVL